MSKDNSTIGEIQLPNSGNFPGETKTHEKVINLIPQGFNIFGTSLSRKNKDSKYQKPIEDFHLVDNRNKIFIIMDGATRFVRDGGGYPDPSPAAIAARLVTNTAHQILAASVYKKTSWKEILYTAASNANELVRYHNLERFPKVDFLENDYANACGIISFIKESSLFYAFVGDPQGYLIRNGKISVFTNNQTISIEELYTEYSRDSKKSMIDFRKHVCGEVRNNKDHSYAFGSFTGEQRALDLLEYGEIKLAAGDRIIFTSDGLLPLFSKKPELFLGSDYNQLFDEMEQLETGSDIRSDDKTLIAIDISN